MMNSNVQAAMPKFAGLSHVCIFVDDMMEAVDYYQKLLGVVPDHYLSHWRNEGFFKAGGFVKEAADGDVSIAFVNVPGTKLTLELMQYHSPEGRKEPVFFAANDVSGARHVALKITNIDEAFLYITGFGGSVYSQTCRIRLLVLFYYLGLRIEIVCRYFALLISASISSFISSYVPSSFASEITFSTAIRFSASNLES